MTQGLQHPLNSLGDILKFRPAVVGGGANLQFADWGGGATPGNGDGGRKRGMLAGQEFLRNHSGQPSPDIRSRKINSP